MIEEKFVIILFLISFLLGIIIEMINQYRKDKNESKKSLIPQDATSLEAFHIEETKEDGIYAYIGYKLSNGNFEFITIPYTGFKSTLNDFNTKYQSGVNNSHFNNTELEKIITQFWLWLVKEAKIDVIDAENAIEVHGFIGDTDCFVPVITFKELIELYKTKKNL